MKMSAFATQAEVALRESPHFKSDLIGDVEPRTGLDYTRPPADWTTHPNNPAVHAKAAEWAPPRARRAAISSRALGMQRKTMEAKGSKFASFLFPVISPNRDFSKGCGRLK